MKRKIVTTPLSWRAVKIGKIYCSPACGRGCTVAEFNKARADGDRLSRTLGANWTSVIHENLGWHFTARARSGFMSVSQFGPRSYWATTENINPQLHAKAATPRAAVRKVQRQARALLAHVMTAVEGMHV